MFISCKKCYNCYTYCVVYRTNTYWNSICGSKAASVGVVDSLVNAGDTIDTNATGWGLVTNVVSGQHQQYCGKSALHDAESSGDSCVEGSYWH